LFQAIRSGRVMNFAVFKEPRGVMRILQFVSTALQFFGCLMHCCVVEYKFGLLMVMVLPLNRYLQYVHSRQQRGLLVMWNSHLVVKGRRWLNLNTRILSGETNFID
jgi:hypothetical protein